jgi:ribbon-helix-helix CopG family protein
MRTTLTVDDELLDRLRREARRGKIPFRTALERALRLGLDRMQPRQRRRPFKQRTFRLGHPPGSRLDKALQLAALLDDEEVVRKMMLGK